MKKNTIYILACFIASTFLLSSCLKDKDYTPTPVGVITMVDGFSDNEGIVYFTDQRPVKQLLYKSFDRDYFYTGNRNLIVRGFNSPTVLIDTTVTIKDQTFYTSFTYGNKEKPKHIITEDTLMVSTTTTATDRAAIRFFNLGDITDKVTLQIGEEAIIPSFKDRVVENQTTASENQSFLPHANGTFKLTVKNEAGAVLATRESVELKTDHYYSIILIGKKDDTKTPLYIGIVEQPVN